MENDSKLKIAIIGLGGIGYRHLQSCINFYKPHAILIYIVDVNPQITEKIINEFSSHTIHCMTTSDDLPNSIDVVIVATQANIRFSVTSKLLTEKKVRFLILEKVLFQEVDEYNSMSEILKKTNTKAYVNCPRRQWLAYQDIKTLLDHDRIKHVSVRGNGWDLGCNAIHFIDLISFLSNSLHYDISLMNLEDLLIESKRKGNYVISGEIEGHFKNQCSFALSTNGKNINEKEIEILTHNNLMLKINETNDKIYVFNSAEEKNYSIQHQSSLTAAIINDLITQQDCPLVSYEDSQLLHLPLIEAFQNHFKKYFSGRITCPIT